MADGWGVVRIAKENRDGKCLMLSGTKYLTECFSLKTTEHVKKHHNLFFFWQLIQCPLTPWGKPVFRAFVIANTVYALKYSRFKGLFSISDLCH